jgi:hypothetical protein
MERLSIIPLARNLRFDECGELSQRFLPAEVAHLDGDNLRDSLLHDVDLRSA